MKYFFGFIAVFFILDALCFYAWIVSGQHSSDGFYAGAMTAKILSLFF